MSLRLTLLNRALRHVAQPLLKRTKSPRQARRDFNLTARFLFRGPRAHAIPLALGGVPCLRVDPPGAGEGSLILYFHGGGYITGAPRTHLPMVGHLARVAGVAAVLPGYRLAPEAPFPAAFDDAARVWRALREAGTPAERIVLGGDSAGGGLALALLAHVLASGERPAGLFAFSPWTDLTLSGASLDENADRDAVLPVQRIRELRSLVAPSGNLADPRLSPLFADFAGAPPIYLQVSESEILRDDSLRLAERLREAGVSVRTDTWHDTPHVWQIFRGWLPEADEALDRVAAFVRDCLRSSPRQSGN